MPDVARPSTTCAAGLVWADNLSLQKDPHSGPYEVKREEFTVKNGVLEASFDFSWADWRALVLEVTNPDGDTATVAFPADSREGRQQTPLSLLDPPIAGSVVPFREATDCVRRLHYAVERELDLPFALC